MPLSPTPPHGEAVVVVSPHDAGLDRAGEAGAGKDCRCRHAPALRTRVSEAHPDVMLERRAAFLRTAPDVLTGVCHAMATLDLRVEFEQVRAPVLVLVGEQDEATPPAMSRELAALLPDARLVVLAGCAHVPQLQDSSRLLAAVDAFLVDG